VNQTISRKRGITTRCLCTNCSTDTVLRTRSAFTQWQCDAYPHAKPQTGHSFHSATK